MTDARAQANREARLAAVRIALQRDRETRDTADANRPALIAEAVRLGMTFAEIGADLGMSAKWVGQLARRTVTPTSPSAGQAPPEGAASPAAPTTPPTAH